MSSKLNSAIAVIGIDIDKNSFHVVGHDKRGSCSISSTRRLVEREKQRIDAPPPAQ